jgi:hypothetical protein
MTRLEDFSPAKLGEIPCMRQSLLQGLAGGTGFAVLRLLSGKPGTSCHPTRPPTLLPPIVDDLSGRRLRWSGDENTYVCSCLSVRLTPGSSRAATDGTGLRKPFLIFSLRSTCLARPDESPIGGARCLLLLLTAFVLLLGRRPPQASRLLSRRTAGSLAAS